MNFAFSPKPFVLKLRLACPQLAPTRCDGPSRSRQGDEVGQEGGDAEHEAEDQGGAIGGHGGVE
eukprot:7604810-Alexandrium_andersonii.AAC.1